MILGTQTCHPALPAAAGGLCWEHGLAEEWCCSWDTSREKNPGTDREGDTATNVRITLPATAKEEMTADEAAERALVTQRGPKQELPRPISLPLAWLYSSTTRENITSELGTFHGEVVPSRDESRSSSKESSSSSSKSSFYTCESSFYTDEPSSSSDSEMVMAGHANVARKKTYTKARKKKVPDELKESALATQRWLARE